jgi:serine protease Do
MGALRRLRDGILLAAVAALGITGLVGGPGFLFKANVNSVAYAQTAQGPVGFADIVDRVKPAVISVRVKLDASPRVMDESGSSSSQETPLDRFLRRFFPDNANPNGLPTPHGNVVTGLASGFFISADGYAVTNNHVVENAEKVQVFTDDGKTYAAKVVGTDPRTDVALIKVDGRADFPYVKFAKDEPRVGDWVLAIGNPFGLGGTVTAGIVSAHGRDIGEGPYDDFIQIDAPVNKGNSGGPSFNTHGNVIGVNTAIVSPSGGSVGIAFAIPAETVEAVIAQLKDKGFVTRGFIGVQIQDVTADIADDLGLKAASGALVAEPQANSPAAKAGIEAGDVITAINGNEIKNAREFARTISNMPPGASVKLTVVRNGQEKIINVTLGELPSEHRASATPAPQAPSGTNVARFGVSVAPHAGGDGVVVTHVDPNGVAAENGFKAGDVILEVGGKKVSNPGDISNAIKAAQKDGKRTVLLRVKSAEGVKYVTLPVGQS